MTSVCLLVPDLTDPDFVSRPAALLASALATEAALDPGAGHDVELVSVRRTGGQVVEPPGPLVRVTWAEDVEVPGTPHRPTPLVPAAAAHDLDLADEARLRRILDRSRPDVVLTASAPLLALASQLAHPATAVLHHLDRVDPNDAATCALLRDFAPRADVVTVLDEDAAHWVRDLLAPVAPKVVVVPHLPGRGWRPRAVPAGEGEPGLVLAQAPYENDEQLPMLLEAFAVLAARHPGWRLRVVGKGSRRNEVLGRAARLGLHDRVEMPAWTRESRADWARADIGVAASRVGGWHLPVLEAYAAGVPFVAPDNGGGVGALIDHEVTGLLTVPQSAMSLGTAMLRLVEDLPLRLRLGGAALRAHEERVASGVGAWGDAVAAAVERRRGRYDDDTALPQSAVGDAPLPQIGGDAARLTPAQARSAVLRHVAEVADRTADGWFLLPRRWPHAPLAVVPLERRGDFLAGLASTAAPSWLSTLIPGAGARHDRRTTLAAALPALRRGMTARVTLEPWPHDADGRRSHLAEGARVEIEFWPAAPDGDRLSIRPNGILPRMPAGSPTERVEVEGHEVPVPAGFDRPTTWDVTFPVDAVYTWVDGNDPAWDAARRERQAAVHGADTDRRSSGRARFTDREELRYSLRSLHLFAPWVRRIFVVTAGQRPAWLADHPGVTVVDHRDILPADALPTFNSHAIETGLHRIEGLAEHFVYVNDDVLLTRPLGPESFFSPGGTFATYASPSALGVATGDDAPFRHAAENVRRLLLEEFGILATRQMAHTPHPHRVSVLRELEQRWPDDLARTARTPFRAESDVSLLSALAQQYGLRTGAAHPAELALDYVELADPALRRRLARLLRQRDVDALCVADGHDFGRRPGWAERELDTFLRAFFPAPAPWESDAGG